MVIKEGDRFFLRVSKSGKGIYAFPPTPEGQKAKWLLIGNLQELKDTLAGRKKACALRVVRARQPVEDA